MQEDLYGFKARKLTRCEWTGSSFKVYFMLGKVERFATITDACRSYCEAHGSKFKKQIKEQLIATMPEELNIWAYPEPYYQQHCHNNIGGYHMSIRVDEDDLTKNWLSKIEF